jgi:hypothetical protein
MEDIQKHPLFYGISFDEVFAKRVKPAFVPAEFDPNNSALAKVKFEGKGKERLSYAAGQSAIERPSFSVMR